MSTPVSRPPAVPCVKCGGKLANHGAIQFKCESCGATSRRSPDADEATALFMLKLGSLGLAFVPLGLIWIEALKIDNLGPFIVLNAVCSLAAGMGLMARVAGWKTTVFAGLAVGVGLFFVTGVVGIFVGCVRAWP